MGHRPRDIFDFDWDPLRLQDMGPAVPIRHDDDFLAGKGLEASIGLLDDKRLVFLHQLDEEGDTGIDIVLVAAECLIQHLQPGIGDLAIGRNASLVL